jgi:ribose transport system permease protein
MAFAVSGMRSPPLPALLFSVKLSGGSPTIANGFPLAGDRGGACRRNAADRRCRRCHQHADRHADRRGDPRFSMLYFEVDATQQQMVFGLVLIIAIAHDDRP